MRIDSRVDADISLNVRTDAAVSDRVMISARTRQGVRMSTEEFHEWFAGRRSANHFRVDRIPLSDLDRWVYEEGTGNLVHSSGRFFSVEGLRVTSSETAPGQWSQPIINQPEIGILGIVVKEFGGVLHCLMQAKMEPGNPNLLQLSPSVQATRSNYTKVHGGSNVKYLDYFIGARPARVVTDVLQSEHGAWFYRKRNRNMIVEALDDPVLEDDFCWLTLGQLGELLRLDNVVNMDSRTVLACAPFGAGEENALHSDTSLLSWFTNERSQRDIRATRIPLARIEGWKRGPESISHAEGRFFDVVGVSVQAGSREVTAWTQPLFEPCGVGVVAFVTRTFGGVRHVLAQARAEVGFLDTVELGPTVQCIPGNYAHLPAAEHPPLLDYVLSAPPERIQYDAVHSEEGGRFLNAESRHLIVEGDEDVTPLHAPPGYTWVTPSQLSTLVRHGRYVNVQGRTMLACLNALFTAA